MKQTVAYFLLITVFSVSRCAIFVEQSDLPGWQSEDAYFVYPQQFQVKRSLGRNCLLTISGCFTTSQQQRYRKYMENVRFLSQ
ncbi:unnamed protein product [Caenorhabditis auriculariae]|uniref:Secreted protein n=1 Tax=Caenorhabditis auriculariae TaxID=2777116 RepID=A0A8S1GRM0_9PELO|nr:unnamed protein product [Caenorhabditis auriculariae]